MTNKLSNQPIVAINTSQIDFEILCISAFRYALGRSTFFIYVISNFIWDYRDKFRKSILELFINEIEERKRIGLDSLGMSVDIECWLSLQEGLKEYIESKELEQ